LPFVGDVKGALVVDLAAGQLELARAALARAVAAGALGPGYAVRRDQEGFLFDGGARADGLDGGRVDLASDGRMTFAVSLRGAERARVAEAVALGAVLGFAAMVLWSWLWPPSLGLAAAAGLGYAASSMVRDRRRARRRLRALAASLAVLVDGVDARG
jgi:hypothetical protein